jgi:hypothetical protein
MGFARGQWPTGDAYILVATYRSSNSVTYHGPAHSKQGGAMEVGPPGWAGANATLKFPSRAASQRYAQVIAVMQIHLGAGAAMVQPFFFCASDHSTEPGWGTV